MSRTDQHDAFVAQQRLHFAEADRAHFAWQTAAPGFAAREAAFVARLAAGHARPLLEIGCGEGANLLHLLATQPAERGLVAGIDGFVRKLAFAARAVPGARFACADAGGLPFRDGAFATVLIRDVLHHLPDPRATLTEACRVLAPGGAFLLAEPNARNPLIRLQMLLVPAERGAARSDATWLEGLLAGLPLDGVVLEPAAPLPLDRVVLHHRFGMPQLGAHAGVRRTLDAVERLAGRVLPRTRWSYIVVSAHRAG